jgi:LCP family protein required for cell wall assembly
VAKGLGIFIILLIIIALVLCFWLYSWVNGQLVHFDALSSSPAGSAETWLILGSDVRDGTPGSGAVGSTNGDRTDTIMVLIKPKSGPAALISIPRDSYVVVNDTGMKINAVAETVGWSGLTSEVENLIGTKIDHVVRVGFAGVQNVVDALGGVRLCYDSDVDDAYSGLTWKAGCHTVDGKTALEFSRMRYSDPTGDIGRTARQRQVIQAVAAKAGSKETLTNVPKAKSVIEALLKTVKVDEETSPWTLLSMVDAFKAATSKDGITGTPYMTDVNYTPSPAVGSTVRLDDKANPGLFRQLVEGSHKAGTVGGMSN